MLISGTGTVIKHNPALLERAKKKAITNHLVLAMVDIATKNGETKISKRYWNTYYCQTKLTVNDGRYYTNWCKNRWCTSCCRIRKAHLIKF